jgi:hypothetical protein
VLAGWVTNLGNVRAARTQAEASAKAQLQGRVRELRRAAYLEFMAQAHVTGELYWQVGDAFAQLDDPQRLVTRIEELRTELRAAYDPLMHGARVVLLEGPAEAAAAAEAVIAAAEQANRALWRVQLGEEGARERFAEGRPAFLRSLERFVEVAREAMRSP